MFTMLCNLSWPKQARRKGRRGASVRLARSVVVLCLAACCLAAHAEENDGYKEYDSNNNTDISVDRYVNRGTVKATGTGSGNYGIEVTSGGFANSGTVNATGNNDGYGILVAAGGFSNSGTVNATGNNDGRGIYVASGGFSNSGTVNATGNDDGVGIRVTAGGFSNSGAVNATGNIGGIGIDVYSGGFSNSGLLTLSGLRSLQMIDGASNDLVFSSGSALALNGGRITIGAGASIRFQIEPGAQLLAPNATTMIGNTTTFNFILDYAGNTPSAADLAAAFNVSSDPSAPVLQYDITKSGPAYSVDVTRIGYASTYAQSGNAGSIVSQLESLLNGQGNIDPESPLYGLATFRSYIDSQPTIKGVRAAAAKIGRERTPQATAAAIPMLADAARLPTGILLGNLFTAYDARENGETAARRAFSASSGMAYANLNPRADRALVVWARPFYHYGEADAPANSGHSDMRENIAGVSVGAAITRGPWSLGFAGHYMYADIDGDAYDSHSHGYGLTVGAGRAFTLGCFTPWVELSAGYTRFELDQTRRPTFLPSSASSKPGVNIASSSLSISNRFGSGPFRLIPKLGADYAFTDMENYRESARAGTAYPMRVKSDVYHSLRGAVGLTAEWSVSDCVGLEARGTYRYEFLDKQATMTWGDRAGTVYGFRTDGRDVGRHSGVLGAGMKWRPTDRVVAGLDYDLHLGRRYVGHRVSASVSVGF